MDEVTDSRALSKAVLDPHWSLEELSNGTPAEQVAAAIAEIEGAQPLSVVEPGFNGPATKAMADALRPIGAKIAPGMGDSAADAWRGAVVIALSDLPPRVALYGLKKAVHVPMEYLNQVDGVARGFADEALKKQRTALHRLKMMRAEIERALNPQRQLETPMLVWTDDLVAEANADFERAGIATRYRLAEGGTVESYMVEREARE